MKRSSWYTVIYSELDSSSVEYDIQQAVERSEPTTFYYEDGANKRCPLIQIKFRNSKISVETQSTHKWHDTAADAIDHAMREVTRLAPPLDDLAIAA